MPSLIAQDYGLQGLLLAVQDEPGFQGASLVMPIGCEGLLQEETLRDGQRQGVPGMKRGEWAEAINMTGRVRAPLSPRSSEQACHREENVRTHISPASCQLTLIYHFAMPLRQPGDLGIAGIIITLGQQRPKDSPWGLLPWAAEDMVDFPVPQFSHL